MSRYDGSDSYVFAGTSVLRNKADIRDQAALDAFEADATALRILEMIEQPIPGRFDLQHLCAMHAYMFQDVYDWAGKLRSRSVGCLWSGGKPDEHRVFRQTQISPNGLSRASPLLHLERA